LRSTQGESVLSIVYQTPIVGETNMYRLNTDLPAVTFLEKFAFEMSQLHINEPDMSIDKEGIAEENVY
jgi:hypothetical protein